MAEDESRDEEGARRKAEAEKSKRLELELEVDDYIKAQFGVREPA